MAVSSVPPAQTATSTQNDARKHHTHQGKSPEQASDEATDEAPAKTGVKNTSAPKLATSGALGTKLNQLA